MIGGKGDSPLGEMVTHANVSPKSRNGSPRNVSLDEAFAGIEQFARRCMKAYRTPGAALCITDRAKTLNLSTYGYSNLDAESPITAGTLFPIASISKSFTCIVLLQLQEERKIDLGDEMKKHLPWFEVKSRHGPIEIRHLMSHTGGIMSGMLGTCSSANKSEVLLLRDTEALAPPGTYFHYSDVGFIALTLLVEEVTGKDIGSVMRERILAPLGMNGTEPSITSSIRSKLAVAYTHLYSDRPHTTGVPLVPATWMEASSGAGSIASSAADMAKYLRMLLNRGRSPRGRIISEKSFSLMTAPHATIDWVSPWGAKSYGYGINVGNWDGHLCIGHGGGAVTWGYISGILTDLDEGVGVAVLTNGPCNTWDITPHAIGTLRAARNGQRLPHAPDVTDFAKVANAPDYVGIYRSGKKQFEIATRGRGLVLKLVNEVAPMERREPDAFLVNHPYFRLFLLRFGRSGEKIVEACHGSDWYVNDRYAGPREFPCPGEWSSLVGHYCSYNPFLPNMRIALRKGTLYLAEYIDESETPLSPLPDGSFRLGEDTNSPERIVLKDLVNGQPMSMNVGGCDYYRSVFP